MTFQEFVKSVVPSRKGRLAKIRNCVGIYDFYKMIRKKGWGSIGHPVTEHDFYSVIRTMGKIMAREAAKGNTVVFPFRMGKIETRKFETGVSFANGKLKINYPISWNKTLKLWYQDEEAKKNKTLVRNECKYILYLKYNKYSANYENRTYYQFVPNWDMKQGFVENINKDKIDTLW